MTPKQQRFADEYLIDLNATRAYKVAYPSCKKNATAAVNGSKMIRNTKVSEYIETRLEKINSEKIADAKEVMEYFTSVMRGETQAEVVVIEGTGEGCSEARKMKKAPDEKERLKAAELLGKRYSLFTDKLDMSGDMDLKVVVDYGDEES